MKLGCKNGDYAIVIYDTPLCAANLGRIVEVRAPVKIDATLDLPCWLIKPVRPTPYLVERRDAVQPEIVDWASRIEHPDAWLLPLRPFEDDASEVDSPGAKAKTESARKAIEAATIPATSMSYRPHSYFGSSDLQIELLGRVTGVVRRLALKDILDQGRLSDIPDILRRAALDEAQREMAGMLHPMLMGGEYLPTTTEGEVEIARICINSTTYDVTSLYARRVGPRIHYRVVDEYEGETLPGRASRTSMRPLTMGQMTNFFLGAWNLCQCLERNFEDDVGAMLEFFRGESEYYPCFDAELRRLVRNRFPTQESSE
jgi:hypothetical protein